MTSPTVGSIRKLGFAALALIVVHAPVARAQVIRSDFWVPNGGVTAIARSGNTIYIGGSFTAVGAIGGPPVARNGLAAIDATTGMATDWNPDANGLVAALAVRGNTVYAGGTFTNVGGQARTYLAALDGTTGQATAWNPSPNADVFGLAVGDSTIFVAGDFIAVGSQLRGRVAEVSLASGLATAFNPNPNGVAHALLVSGSTLYLGGDFTHIGGAYRSLVAALDPATGLATSWNPAISSASDPDVRALALAGSTLYVGGYFDHCGGQLRSNLAAIDAGSGQVTGWNPGASNRVLGLGLSGGSLFVDGEFLSLGGQSRDGMGAVDPVSGAATAWDAGSNDRGLTLAASGGDVYVGGSFTQIGAQPRTYFAAFSDGTTGVGGHPVETRLALSAGSPNPAHGSTVVAFTLPVAARVSLALYDAQGRLVRTLLDHAPRPAGEHQVALRTADLHPGLYFERLDVGGGARALAKLLVLE